MMTVAKAAASSLRAACASRTSAPVSLDASAHVAVHSLLDKDASSWSEGALKDAFLYVAWPMSAFACAAHVS